MTMPFIEIADRTSLLVTGASLTVCQGAGHGLYASDHDALNADLLAFISDHRAGDGLRSDSPSR
jgi:hypothetical protein